MNTTSVADEKKPEISAGLVDVHGLREILFPTERKPSVEWLRRQTQNRTIPCVRIGRLVWYSPPAVLEKLTSKNTVRAR